VGLKPARGRIPKGPWVSEILHGFSTDGCVSVDVADTAAMLDALSFWDPNAWTGVQKPAVPFLAASKHRAPRVRIGFTTTSPLAVAPEQPAIDAVTKAATLLNQLGFPVEEAKIKWPMPPDELERDFLTVWATGSAYLEFPDWSEVEDVNKALLAQAKAQSSHDYIKALVRLQLFSRHLLNAWGQDFDVLLTPTIAREPPKVGWIFEGNDVMHRAAEMVPYSGWINVTGQPAISLPLHVSENGLPVGVQLVGAPWREDLLLQISRELEEATNWQASLPV
jgi:amidase